MRKTFYIFLLFTTGFLFAEYKNTNGVASDKSFGDMLQWIRSDIEPEITKIELSLDWQKLNLSEDDNYAIWIGHSTFLIKKNGVTILTDPIFSKRASPFKNIGPKRLIPPAIPLDAIPHIDIVTVSHNHYDHLDIHSLKKISKKHPEAIFLVPAGDEKLLKRKKIKNVYNFDWWESIEHKGFVITFTPVQHWSKRSLFDRNKSLWGGWFFNHKDYSLYHAGDTGYSKDFIDTKIKLGSPKYAFIPIGAYDPEWFMAESHVNPEDAVQIMLDLEAEKAFGMHWATFVLTDEDTIEPKIRLEKEIMKYKDLDFISVVPGSIINLD
ncbi:MBL fold metallo-hydrolase [Gammaproteobacteria bacterium]|jgi:L-ascorbate metabolism protein UlaG (beta-lactamase superfamily)|nr:MBL fold metallo-hydrolase [Gammaproteobacteria bacterium]MDB2503001.1 MBL fold metallo-hydrolase [Gammaproteobacteria bacterium]MDB2604837.1 MBL fold metallo-hydrolase [Gammaproteobacteria bacterium]MDB2704746.1 MBL fold metallo-hydrolase [Gammaproteobacteria bacterium]MDC0347873.1 MBL fold metallo-hydrolase [Gammaproteobacteria bacterium]